MASCWVSLNSTMEILITRCHCSSLLHVVPGKKTTKNPSFFSCENVNHTEQKARDVEKALELLCEGWGNSIFQHLPGSAGLNSVLRVFYKVLGGPVCNTFLSMSLENNSFKPAVFKTRHQRPYVLLLKIALCHIQRRDQSFRPPGYDDPQTRCGIPFHCIGKQQMSIQADVQQKESGL